MQSIESYNEEEGEPLGRYLKGHKHSDWFPIPYLQILSKLHSESIKNKTESFLNIWQKNLKFLMATIASTE